MHKEIEVKPTKMSNRLGGNYKTKECGCWSTEMTTCDGCRQCLGIGHIINEDGSDATEDQEYLQLLFNSVSGLEELNNNEKTNELFDKNEAEEINNIIQKINKVKQSLIKKINETEIHTEIDVYDEEDY